MLLQYGYWARNLRRMLVVRRLRNESTMNHEGRELKLEYDDPPYSPTRQPQSLTLYSVDRLMVVWKCILALWPSLSVILNIFLNVDASIL